jgi:DNA polymerase-3 subunit delta'
MSKRAKSSSSEQAKSGRSVETEQAAGRTDRLGGLGRSPLRGHQHIWQTLIEAESRGRLGHAYLFTGPRGVGKCLLAHQWAKYLLCESPQRAANGQACGVCVACRYFDAGTHPDFFYVCKPPEKHELPIDLIRELCGKPHPDLDTESRLAGSLALKPLRGGYQIAVVDDADDLSEAAANSFLKFLEEPPPRSLLILIGTEPERQLPTIQSRCQVIQFGPLSAADLTALLHEHGVDEPGQVQRLVQASGGSIGLALALNDAELWAYLQRLTGQLAQPYPDTPQIAREMWAFVEAAGKESAAQRQRAALVVRLLVDWLMERVRRLAGGEADPERPGWLQIDTALELVERCLQADRQLTRRVQLVLVIDALADAFARPRPTRPRA